MASSININQNNNTVSLQDQNRKITISDNVHEKTVNITQPVTNVVNVTTIGPQGPQGPQFSSTATSLNDSNKVNNSVVYFDSSSGTFKADQTRTVENLVDGGNF